MDDDPGEQGKGRVAQGLAMSDLLAVEALEVAAGDERDRIMVGSAAALRAIFHYEGTPGRHRMEPSESVCRRSRIAAMVRNAEQCSFDR